MLDEDLCVITANTAFLQTFHVDDDATIGDCLTKLGNGQWDIPDLKKLLHEVMPKSAAVIGYEVTYEFPSLGESTMLVTGRRLSNPDSNSCYLLVVFDDIMEVSNSNAARGLIVAEIEHRVRNFLAMVTALA